MESNAGDEDELNTPLVNSLEEQIKSKRASLANRRKFYPPKCSKYLESILKLQIDNVLNAKVDIKLPANSNIRQDSTQDDEKHNTMEEQKDSPARMSNVLSSDEEDSFEKKMQDLAAETTEMDQVLKCVQSQQRCPIIELFQN